MVSTITTFPRKSLENWKRLKQASLQCLLFFAGIRKQQRFNICDVFCYLRELWKSVILSKVAGSMTTHNFTKNTTPPLVFMTFSNEANGPESQNISRRSSFFSTKYTFTFFQQIYFQKIQKFFFEIFTYLEQSLIVFWLSCHLVSLIALFQSIFLYLPATCHCH